MFTENVVFDAGSLHSENGKESNAAPIEYQNLAKCLEQKFGVISDCLLDGTGYVRCAYFQDSFMKDIYSFFPNRLCVDVTFKRFATNIYMILFIAEDSNGRNHIVAMGYVVSDDSASVEWLVSTFKKQNPNCRGTKTVVCDSDLRPRDSINKMFPQSYILICFYHAYRSFKEGLSDLNSTGNFPDEQSEIALDFFKKMYLANNQYDYEFFYQQLLLTDESIVSYFQEIWVPLQYQMRLGLNHQHENIFGTLNEFLEHLNKSFKSAFYSEDNIIEFIEKSFHIINLNRNETLKMTMHINPKLYSRFSTESYISQMLTPYAAKFVITQFDISSDLQINYSDQSGNFWFDNNGSSITTSSTLCLCNFFLYTLLPCRHIFACRKALSLCVFEENLFDFHWNFKYYQSAIIGLKDSLAKLPDNVYDLSRLPLSQVAVNVIQGTMDVLLNTSEAQFQSRITLLNDLLKSWKMKEEVILEFAGLDKKATVPESSTNTSSHENEFPILPPLSVSPGPSKMENSEPYINIVTYKDPDEPNSSEAQEKESQWNFDTKLLDSKFINFAYLCRVICESKETCLNWLQQLELVQNEMFCPSCNSAMIRKSMPQLPDGAIWICPADLEGGKTCGHRCSIRQGSWFELTNMTFEQVLVFCYLWLNGFTEKQIMEEAGISSLVYKTWSRINKKVCAEILAEEGYLNTPVTDALSDDRILDVWMSTSKDEDPFLKFLQEANTIHRKFSVDYLIQ